jgi:hypothetical protein
MRVIHNGLTRRRKNCSNSSCNDRIVFSIKKLLLDTKELPWRCIVATFQALEGEDCIWDGIMFCRRGEGSGRPPQNEMQKRCGDGHISFRAYRSESYGDMRISCICRISIQKNSNLIEKDLP